MLSPIAGRSNSNDDATHEGHDNHGEEDTAAVAANSSETGDEESQSGHDDGHGYKLSSLHLFKKLNEMTWNFL